MAKLFESLPPRASKEADSRVVSRTSKKTNTLPVIKGGSSAYNRMAAICSIVTTKLGKYSSKYILLRDEESVRNYFNVIRVNGCGAIDTETTSLDPILCTLAGVCVYTPGQKPAYIPLNHVSYITGSRVENQVSNEVITDELRLCEESSVRWYMHKAVFDSRVLWNQLSVCVSCSWDTLLAAKCLNENESAALKALHLKYCESEDTEELSYSSLFGNVSFTTVPLNIAYLYAAGDALKTFELAEFQQLWLNEKTLPGPYNVFRNIEMPLVPFVAEMENTGVALDLSFAEKLSIKYNNQLKERETVFYSLLSTYEDKINVYRKTSRNNKLADPISIYSPTQLAVLFYDILKCKSNDKKKPRGTGRKILLSFDLPLAAAALDCKETQKLLTTYIEKMPKIINPRTGRIHCGFNQYGAATGRFSSSDPNMQNIPSKNKEIRQMFIAAPGNVFISCDFSQQEPRTLAHMSGDVNLIQAYSEGKDIYAWIASSIYKVDYDECREKRADGSINPQGKKRRESVKSIILGIMYGRHAKAIAEQLNITTKEAQKIIDKFFISFPSVKKWMDSVLADARRDGFVSTAWGRKRRLPTMCLPDYSFSYLEKVGVPNNFDPLDFESVAYLQDNEVDEDTIFVYTKKLSSCWGYAEKLRIIEEARQQGIRITDNTMNIADTERQCVNSIIQGTSADMTKIAMRLIGEDPLLRQHEAKMVLQVHDEIIVEAPKACASLVADRVCSLMISAAQEKITVPMKCDAEIAERWYGTTFDAEEFIEEED